MDRSDEVVVGTTERDVKAGIVFRMPEEQRGDARGATSTRGVPWQQTSAETAEGELVNAACVASVRLTGTVMEPRHDKARWFCIRRGVKLAECGFSKGCEGCRVAASGDEVLRPRGKECPGAHQSGYDVRRRGPGETAYAGGATRASSTGRKNCCSSVGPGTACEG